MPATPRTPARILALEDDGALLELVGCVLEADGHRVRGCGTVAEALGAARREPPDLVVLDLVLGGPDDGWAFLERLRADPRTRAVPVVVCTADAAGPRERADVVARQAASPHLHDRARRVVGAPRQNLATPTQRDWLLKVIEPLRRPSARGLTRSSGGGTPILRHR